MSGEIWDVARLCASLGQAAKSTSRLVFAEAYRVGVKDGHFLSLAAAKVDVEDQDPRAVVCEFYRPGAGDFSKHHPPEHALHLWPDARVSIEGRFLERVEEDGCFRCYRESFADVNRETLFDLAEYIQTRSLGGSSAEKLVRELPLSSGMLRLASVGDRVYPFQPNALDEDANLARALLSDYPVLSSQKGIGRLFRRAEARNSHGFVVQKWTCELPASRMDAFFGFQPTDLVEEALAEFRAYREHSTEGV
jgi:hypothetical protein